MNELKPKNYKLSLAERNIQGLRSVITNQQRKLLDFIWVSLIEKPEGPSSKYLKRVFKNGDLNQILETLSGGLVWELEAQEVNFRYRLTTLGVLMTSEGELWENILLKYIKYLRERYLDHPEFKEIDSATVAKALELNPREEKVLGILLMGSEIYGDTFGGGLDGTWSTRPPKDVDDIPENAQLYLQTKLFKHFDPLMPVFVATRGNYHHEKNNLLTGSEFWFIRDESLRIQLQEDWSETKRLYALPAYKSCVILCGGLLEGMLMDVLEGENDPKTLSGQPPKPLKDLEKWGLADLIQTARDLKILSPEASDVGSATRGFRNLIHPGKQVRTGLKATMSSANVAYACIQMCIPELAKYCDARNGT